MICKSYLWIQLCSTALKFDDASISPHTSPVFLKKDEWTQTAESRSSHCRGCTADFSKDNEYLNSISPGQYSRIVCISENEGKCYMHLSCLANRKPSEADNHETEHGGAKCNELEYSELYVLAFEHWINDKIVLTAEDVEVMAQRIEIFDYLLSSRLTEAKQKALAAKIYQMPASLNQNQTSLSTPKCLLLHMLEISKLFYRKHLDLDNLFKILKTVQNSNNEFLGVCGEKTAEYLFLKSGISKNTKRRFLLSYADFIGRTQVENFGKIFSLFLDSLETSKEAESVLQHIAFSKYAYLFICFGNRITAHHNFPETIRILDLQNRKILSMDWLMHDECQITHIDHFLAWLSAKKRISTENITSIFNSIMAHCVSGLNNTQMKSCSAHKTLDSVMHFLRHKYTGMPLSKKQRKIECFAYCSLAYDVLLTKILCFFSEQILSSIDLHTIIKSIQKLETQYKVSTPTNYLFLREFIRLSRVKLRTAIKYYYWPIFDPEGVYRVLMHHSIGAYEFGVFEGIEYMTGDRPAVIGIVKRLLHSPSFVTDRNYNYIRDYLKEPNELLYHSKNNCFGFYESCSATEKTEILLDMLKNKTYASRGNIIFSIDDEKLLHEHVGVEVFRCILEESWIIWHLEETCSHWMNEKIPLIVLIYFREFKEITNRIALQNVSIKPYLQALQNKILADHCSENNFIGK
ncbi:hypothetical protein ENBRE01_1314 [Enteropsectra breve]|nr:hypothetical protein ENBRE01_1314 [Enteropsectra breve]